MVILLFTARREKLDIPSESSKEVYSKEPDEITRLYETDDLKGRSPGQLLHENQLNSSRLLFNYNAKL